MKELEIKILGVKPNDVRQKLKKIGAKKIFSGKIIAQYYDSEGYRIRSRGNLLRLRMFGDKPQLTIKNTISRKKYKITEEMDIAVEDFKKMHNALCSIGFECYGRLKKTRERWVLDGLSFEIDKYPNLPYYLEIEVKTDKSMAAAKKKLEKAVKMLGFKMEDAKPMNAFEVHQYYGKKL